MQGAADVATTGAWRGRCATLALAACAFALVDVLEAASPVGRSVPAICQAGSPDQAPTHHALALLRDQAMLGDADASAALVGALLDAYDAGAGGPALVDALQWLQRDLYTTPMLASGQIERLVSGACRHDALLRQQWLCHEGE